MRIAHRLIFVIGAYPWAFTMFVVEGVRWIIFGGKYNLELVFDSWYEFWKDKI